MIAEVFLPKSSVGEMSGKEIAEMFDEERQGELHIKSSMLSHQ